MAKKAEDKVEIELEEIIMMKKAGAEGSIVKKRQKMSGK